MFYNEDLLKRNRVWLGGAKNKPGAIGATRSWYKTLDLNDR